MDFVGIAGHGTWGYPRIGVGVVVVAAASDVLQQSPCWRWYTHSNRPIWVSILIVINLLELDPPHYLVVAAKEFTVLVSLHQ